MAWSRLPQETWENKESVNKACLESMVVMAHWDKASFFEPVKILVDLLDRADHVDDLLNIFPQALASSERLPLSCHKYKLLHDASATYSGKRVHLRLAPLKDVGSALRKSLDYYEEFHGAGDSSQYEGPACAYVTDMIRLTVSAADPYVIYIFYKLLCCVPTFKVMQVKNKYLDKGFEESGSPSILLKVKVYLEDRRTTICEAQLYVDAFLALKKLSHKTYEVTRVEESNNIRPLLKPLFETTKRVEAGMSKAVATKNAKEMLEKMASVADRDRVNVAARAAVSPPTGFDDIGTGFVEMTAIRW